MAISLRKWVKKISSSKRNPVTYDPNDIAVVGMACRFPDADDYDQFWNNLINNTNSIKEIPTSRWDIKKYYSPDRDAPNKSISKWGGLLDAIDKFDAPFFHISAREACAMDPQQRLLLEETWHCIEDSGIPLEHMQQQKTSVYVGVMAVDYQHRMFGQSHVTDSYECLGNYEGILANRLSYFFNFTGDSHSIDAACASSLVVIHEARRSLLLKESDFAIAAGVSIICHPWRYISFSKSHMLSPDGQCKTFDAKANGYVPGEGLGVLLLCSLQKAVENGYHIYGIIKGSAVKHTGKSKSITAPRVEIERQVIEEAIESSKISPKSISYIEAHGTGTSLGDPIEVEALTQAFRTDKKQYCYIGTVKTNIGHLEAAAGIAGVIKVLLMMKHKKIPKTLNIENVNPIIEFEKSPFRLANKLRKWKLIENIKIRRAGVSSFGFGGVNSHVIIEEYVEPKVSQQFQSEIDSESFPFILSAKSKESLDRLLVSWRNFVNQDSFEKLLLKDICLTLLYGRENFSHRLSLFTDKKNLLEILNSDNIYNEVNVCDDKTKKLPIINFKNNTIDINYSDFKSICQKYPILLKLKEEYEENLSSIDEGLLLLKGIREGNEKLFITLRNFLVNLVLGKAFILSGVNPKFIVGKGTGGLEAAVLTGVLSFNQAVNWLLNQESVVNFKRPSISFYDVANHKIIEPYIVTEQYCKILSEKVEFDSLVKETLIKKTSQLIKYQYTFKKYLAAWNKIFDKEEINLENFINGSQGLSNSKESLVLIAIYISYKQLNQKWDLEEKINLNNPYTEEVTNLLLDRVLTEDDMAKLLLEKDSYGLIANKIQFNQGLIDKNKNYPILRLIHNELVEIGDARHWMKLITSKDAWSSEDEKLLLDYWPIEIDPCLLDKLPEFLTTLWKSGVNISWNLWYPDKNYKKIALPVYPFLKERYWFEETKSNELIGKTIMSDVYYFTPAWKKQNLNKAKKEGDMDNLPLLVFDDEGYLAKDLREKLGEKNIIRVRYSSHYEKITQIEYQINRQSLNDYIHLLIDLAKYSKLYHIIYVADNRLLREINKNDINEKLDRNYFSLLFLVQALLHQYLDENIRINCVNMIEKGFFSFFSQAIAGFAKTVSLENPAIMIRTLGVNQVDQVIDELSNNDVEVYYDDHSQRYVREYQEIKPEISQTSLKEKGTYLITGGAGGLGLILASFLAKNYQAQLILTGRSPLNDKIKQVISELEKQKSEVLYVQSDVSRKDEVEILIKQAKEKFGPLNGIIHCAGVIKDAFLIQKSPDDSKKVFEAKILGTLFLDDYTKTEPLDFFILFSSITSILGNVGQCDYGYANRFLDAYSDYRNELTQRKERQGKTMSMIWPLWEHGGMQIDHASQQWWIKMLGIDLLPTEEGVSAFEHILSQPFTKAMALTGNKEKIVSHLSAAPIFENISKKEKIDIPDKSSENNDAALLIKIQNQVLSMTAALLALNENDLDIEADLSHYGLDSIAMTDLIISLDEYYGLELTPAVLFEHKTLKSFTLYLFKNYRNEMEAKHGSAPKGEPIEEETLNVIKVEKKPHFKETPIIHPERKEDIAIIGISGNFPGSKNLDIFWENLEQQKDLISEVSKLRWDWEKYYGNDKNKTKVKWGGFIENFDKFDAEFFKISPREAELMDPQHRLFLQTAWKVVEDAGYSIEELSNVKTGVFVGISCNDYSELVHRANETSAHVPTGIYYSLVSNRVSYLLNLNGPSLTIDTACSSSLVALHQAVKAIQSGECNLAIAGGVNTLVSPSTFIEFDQAGMLSAQGRCKTFDKSANGYARGEGAGAILLKPLSQAIADKDTIYGIVKGSAVNHGGHVSSLTVPNPVAQAEVIMTAYEHANIDVNTISCIEAHGTGTSLGDPIEINGLKHAFQTLQIRQGNPSKINYCGVSTVKTNIGHLEGAAGIAGVIKILLAMQHHKLPGIVNFKELNPYIDLKNSPFYILEKTQDWVHEKDEEGYDIPYRAGVSSFGFGGTNAHVLLEEAPSQNLSTQPVKQAYLITLSAKTKNALERYGKNLEDWLEKNLTNKEISIEDISFTLNKGRSHFNYRCGFIVNSLQELLEVLKQVNNGKRPSNYLFGTIKKKIEREPIFEVLLSKILEDITQQKFDETQYRKKLLSLGDLYIKGYSIDWDLLHQDEAKRRVHLPTYPFEEIRYWVGDVREAIQTPSKENLSPLIDNSQSTSSQMKFTKHLTGSEFYLTDHKIAGASVLPGVVYLEMAREAGSLTSTQQVVKIQNVTWSRPIVVKAPTLVNIELKPKTNGVSFLIKTMEESQDEGKGVKEILHAQGKIFYDSKLKTKEKLNIEAIKNRCKTILPPSEQYQQFKNLEFEFGPGMQSIKEFLINGNEALIKLILPDSVKKEVDKFYLHPSILDGAFQSCSYFSMRMASKPVLYLPFSVGELEIFGPLRTLINYVYIRFIEESQLKKMPAFNIELADEEGNVVVAIKDFTMRDLGISEKKQEIYYFHPLLKNKFVQKAQDYPITSMVLVDEESELYTLLTQGLFQQKSIFHLKEKEQIHSFINEWGDSKSDRKYILFHIKINADRLFEQITDYYNLLLSLIQNLITHKIKNVSCLCLIEGDDKFSYLYSDAFSGFLRSVEIEQGKENFKSVVVKTPAIKIENIGVLVNEFYSEDSYVSYEGSRRFINSYEEEIVQNRTGNRLLKKEGTYFITGGIKGLGFIFAKYLAKNYQSKLGLVGRSPLTSEIESKLKELENLGAMATYIQADVANLEEITRAYLQIQEQHGKIDGIIHSAGVVKDAFLINKTLEDSKKVFEPKIMGALHLDELTQTQPLDFFILFSSVTSVLGNIGQCDYALANGFMDGFAKWRENLRQTNQRQGKTISINWPLWAKGGMQIDEASQAWLNQTFGSTPLDTEEGLKAFIFSLTQNHPQKIILTGQKQKLMKALGLNEIPDTGESLSRGQEASEAISIVNSNKIEMQIDKDFMKEKVTEQVVNIVAELLKLPAQKIKPNEELGTYGMDSVNFTEFSIEVNNLYGLDLTPAILFEHTTLQSFVDFLVNTYPEKMKIFHCVQSQTDSATLEIPKELTSESKSSSQQEACDQSEKDNDRDIAIIGMNGRFPGSSDLEAFWENLEQAKDLITQVPEDRWEYWKTHYSDLIKDEDLIKWGAFMEGVADFDATFFNISRREAELIDPQQRLFLETAWKTIEDAGYTPAQLSKIRTGLFAGIGTNDYALMLADAHVTTGHVPTGVFYSLISNRVSFTLNLHGPSESIDTACSSSLTAIHNAINSIRNGDCDVAIAGGVGTLLLPHTYIAFSQAGMLSQEGRCKTFDKSANGYVRGEGVGAILLKPLNKAIADKDYIYGIIKGSAVNHGGRVNSLTVPNPNAQAEVIVKAIERSRVDIDSMSYIEAHGTGTSLGDPIEVNGLKKAFSELLQKEGKNMPAAPYCAIGSVKTNVGHLEAAAGISGVIKVLLSMEHKTLPALMNFNELNPYIDLENSPFYLLIKNQEWKRLKDNQGNEYPRRAGVSSFGFGGTNAHMVIEEPPARSQIKPPTKPYYLITLSAKTKRALNQKVIDLEAWLMRKEKSSLLGSISIEDVAYTLNNGRSHYEKRLAIIADSLKELHMTLQKLIQQQPSEKVIHIQDEEKYKDQIAAKELLKTTIQNLAKREGMTSDQYHQFLVKVADFYIHHFDIDWEQLHLNESQNKIPLPTYPFEKKRYWLQDQSIFPEENQVVELPVKTETSKKDYLLLEKTWHASTEKPDDVLIQGKILVLINDAVFLSVQKLFNNMPLLEPVYIQCEKASSTVGTAKYSLVFNQEEEGRRIANQILSDNINAIGIFDFSDLASYLYDQYPWGKLTFLQEILKQKINEPFYLFHFTQELQNFKVKSPSIVGAQFASLIRILGEEYRKLVAKTIDIDDLNSLGTVVFDELASRRDFSEVCYRDGKKYFPQFQEIFRKPVESDIVLSNIPISPEKVYVITGGTRGIGHEIAYHLIKQGAKRLVLMGLQAIPERNQWESILEKGGEAGLKKKISNILALEKKGIQVELFTGSLTDREALVNFFERIRTELGQIAGVFHCAGLVNRDNPAFINKSIKEMQSVSDPKIAGLWQLHEIFKNDKLDFFILFSSISAQIPALGVGLSDYAMANGFMDFFASYQQKSGYHYYRSVAWSSWKETGMGEVHSGVYSQLGLLSLTNHQGFYLLEKAISLAEKSGLLASVIDHSSYKLDSFSLKLSQASKIPHIKSNETLKRSEGKGVPLWLTKLFSEELKLPISELKPDTSFSDLGVDSILLAELVYKIEKVLDAKLDPSVLIEHSNLNKLHHYLLKNYSTSSLIEQKTEEVKLPIEETKVERIQTPPRVGSIKKIAVIGMACHFPGAKDIHQFWKNLKEGKSSITEVPTSRWDVNRFYSPIQASGKSISKWGGFIENIEYFDPGYFGIPENDAPQVDPLERQFLEISAQVLRDAGYEKNELWNKKVGIFVGSRVSNYSERITHLRKNTIVGTGQNFIAAHASHILNFTGPSFVIDSACSSSLVSVHMACQSLQNADCELAIAGGVDILLDERPYLILSESKALSPDGKCHTFDEAANGFVPGEGCGAVLLKPLENAIKDGDKIYAVIEATAVNNDGHTMGVTTPNPISQREIIKDALHKASIDPSTISYIEAHGTGTMIGDPIELKALSEVFSTADKKQYCAVGSVKTNIGHLASAAGIASFIKVALSLYHKQLVPTLNCEKPNPRFDFENSPFYPNTQLKDWIPIDGTYRAGMSSFGFGGTNAHCILSSIDQYQISTKRTSLSSIAFNRKQYWLEKEVDNLSADASEVEGLNEFFSWRLVS